MAQTYIIGVCGASCSGKTTICKKMIDKIKSILGDDQSSVTLISQDSYYFGGDSNTNYDVPSSIDFDLMIEQIKELKNGNDIESPVYDFGTHSRKKDTKKIKSTKIIIIEGILIFSVDKIRELCNLKVFVSAYPELMYSRRLKRDQEERGRTHEEIDKQYFRDVLPASKYYVEPTMYFSDIAIMNNVQGRFVGLEILLDHVEKKIKEIQ